MQDGNQGDIRIDANAGSRHWLMGRFSRQIVNTLNPSEFPAVRIAGLDTPLDLGGRDPSGIARLSATQSVLAWTFAPNPSALLEVRMGFTRFDSALRPAGMEEGSKLGERLGIPGANQGSRSDGLPILDLAGYTGIGHGRTVPTLRIENTFNPRLAFTKIQGSHTWKTGLSLTRRQVTDFQLSAAAGDFVFSREFTADPNSAGATGETMASFLLGAASSIEQDFLYVWPGIRAFETGLFVQDTWRASDRLTIELGLRYDYDAPLSEVHDRWANFDVLTGTLRLAGINSDSAVGVRRDWNNLGPRFSFALRASDRLVVRGGYGILFNTQGNGNASFRLHRQDPYGPVSVVDVDLFAIDPRV